MSMRRLVSLLLPLSSGCPLPATSSLGQQSWPVASCCATACATARARAVSGNAASSSNNPAAEESIEQVRARIFGDHIGNGLPSGRKVLRHKLQGPRILDYYIEPLHKADPLYVDMQAEERKSKLSQLKRRGKGPPKKGQGKRSKKK